MLSRNRSTCGVKPYIRATCNPDADSWVAEFIAWWIDQETGYPIPERSGKIRWFIRLNDAFLWADTKEELIERYGSEVMPKSVTFVAAKLSDNKILEKADPGYRANLLALNAVERERLLGGNWKIRPAAGLYFRRGWCEVVDIAPAGLQVVRYWDLAATVKTEGNDPDWTVGIKMGFDPDTGIYYVLGREKDRLSPHGVQRLIKNTATADGPTVRIGTPQDPGQAGKVQVSAMATLLTGFDARSRSERGDKIVRFGPFSAQAEAGNVKVLRGAWNEDFFACLEAFPESAHDDDVDGCSGAFGMFLDNNLGLLDFYRAKAEERNQQPQGWAQAAISKG
jgi:predicted phage terminase large subunit-like protein